MPLSNEAQSLLSNNAQFRWNTAQPVGVPVVLTYSFQSIIAAYDTFSHGRFFEFTEQHQWHVRTALDKWEAVSGLTFLELETGGQIRFSLLDDSSFDNFGPGVTTGYARLPNFYTLTDGTTGTLYDTLSGDIFLNGRLFGTNSVELEPGNIGFETVLHEIGHALGLEHPFEGQNQISSTNDNTDVTVMSYTDGADPSSLGTADLEAIRFLYGTTAYETSFNEALMIVKQIGTAASEHMHGTELSDVLIGNGGADSIFGADGDDFIFATSNLDADGGNGRDTVITQLGNNSYYDSGGIHGTNVTANTDLSVDDYYLGGFGNDSVDGGNGNDVLIGDRLSHFLSGQDTLIGGLGSDFLQGGSNADVFRFRAFSARTKDNVELGPDVIGRVDENTLHNIMSSASPTIDDFIAQASKDFELGIDKIELDDLNSFGRSEIRNNLSNYLRDTADGVIFEAAGNAILFIDLTEAEMLAEGSANIFDFI